MNVRILVIQRPRQSRRLIGAPPDPAQKPTRRVAEKLEALVAWDLFNPIRCLLTQNGSSGAPLEEGHPLPNEGRALAALFLQKRVRESARQLDVLRRRMRGDTGEAQVIDPLDCRAERLEIVPVVLVLEVTLNHTDRFSPLTEGRIGDGERQGEPNVRWPFRDGFFEDRARLRQLARADQRIPLSPLM